MSTATPQAPLTRPVVVNDDDSATPITQESSQLWTTVQKVLAPLASLKLTVALFLAAIFIVFAGTLAQVRLDIWEVIHDYFRVDFARLFPGAAPWFDVRELFVWVEAQLLFPPAFFPPEPTFPAGFGWVASFWPHGQPQIPSWIGIAFPKGWVIGAVMMLNLFAAHLLRFKVQASGSRLWGGWVVIAMGCLITWLVIGSGSNPDGVQGAALVSYPILWNIVRMTLLALCGASIYAAVAVESEPAQRWLWATMAAVLAAATLASASFDPGDASMRIMYQLVKATLAGLVLLVGCIMVFKQRAGIVLLHGGIALVMAYDVLVGVAHVESQMFIVEGQSVSHSTDMRTSELVFVDSSNSLEDEVTAVSGQVLRKGAKISDERLPVDIEIVDWLPNSEIVPPIKVTEDQRKANLATTGVGKELLVQPVRQSVGTDTDSKFDSPSAYVKLTDRKSQTDLGTYLVSTRLNEGLDKIKTDAGEFAISLRFQHLYKNYSVRLDDFQKNNYMGTSSTKDFSSYVTITPGGGKASFEQRIWMNNPLRYAGDTLYQSSFVPASDLGMGDKEATVLQVVSNEGWMTPYVSCMIVLVGMLAQFGQTLLRYLGRRARLQDAAHYSMVANSATGETINAMSSDTPEQRSRRNTLAWIVTASVLLIPTLLVSVKLMPSRSTVDKYNLVEFGRLPMWYKGRQMPLDSFARNVILRLSDKETFWNGETKADKKTIKRQPAIEWLLMMVSNREQARAQRIFRIENLELLHALGLEKREGLCYAMDELQGKFEEVEESESTASPEEAAKRERWKKFIELAGAAREMDEAQRNLFQRKTLDLADRVSMYLGLERALSPAPKIPADVEIDAERFAKIDSLFRGELESSGTPPLLVPVHVGVKEVKLEPTWETPLMAGLYGQMLPAISRPTPAAIEAFGSMVAAATEGNITQFNERLGKYRALLNQHDAADGLALAKSDFEYKYNVFDGFNMASWLYVVAGCLAAIGWLCYPQVFQRASFGLLIAVLAIHTAALVGRLYISGRPPVTNLYSASVFIGWAAVFGGLIVERMTKLGFGSVVAAVAGFLSLRVADGLASDGDTFVVLEAVLDTQFWLATHVVTVTLGYATTYLAGIMGGMYILGGVLTPALKPGVGKEITRMTYGVLCFATFFSFVGTVLGGLWADDSWGRFWGWDPKENGALIIVLWNALVLHARWGAMIKERGLAILAVLGNVVVTWSYFGVNELGVGLHSYGFTEGRLLYMLLFCSSQMAIAALGCLPFSVWSSKRAQQSLNNSLASR